MSEPLPPRIIDRYAIFDPIAAGGMGTVHLGRLLGPVGFSRTVAVKRMRPELTLHAEAVKMFIDEAKIASRVHHPNVVPVLDAVVVEGELYLVMEYVAGEALSQCLVASRAARERVPIAIAVAIVVGALHGLHAAHEATDDMGAPLGVVHRDVSPQNVLVGVDGLARVLDFGVAKATGRLQQTRPGQIKGKLLYTAPEQWTGKEVDRRADVYAAGLVLWEMLAGKHAFAGMDVVGQQMRATTGVSEPPSTHAWSRSDRTLRDDEMALLQRLDDVVMRAVAVDPETRFATARDMATALETLVSPATQSATRQWVEGLVGAQLSDRSNRVRDVERRSASLPEPVGVERQARSRATLPQDAKTVEPSAGPRRRAALRPGETAPEIDATATDGQRFVLSQSPKPYTVVYFFPKAFTPGCTREAGLFRDNYAEIQLAGARVVGISTDDHATQCKFASSTSVPFPMVADADGTISRSFGVLWPLIRKPKRLTFIVDGSRKVMAVFRHELSIIKHRDDVLLFLDTLRQKRGGAW